MRQLITVIILLFSTSVFAQLGGKDDRYFKDYQKNLIILVSTLGLIIQAFLWRDLVFLLTMTVSG
ncbi:MAG: hypothetical protein IPN49_02360 [Saprospiraceae bacterium]|nr:hypothetical protein [Saprospiraceae bacterium]